MSINYIRAVIPYEESKHHTGLVITATVTAILQIVTSYIVSIVTIWVRSRQYKSKFTSLPNTRITSLVSYRSMTIDICSK